MEGTLGTLGYPEYLEYLGCEPRQGTVVREVVWAARGEGPSEYPEYDGT